MASPLIPSPVISGYCNLNEGAPVGCQGCLQGTVSPYYISVGDNHVIVPASYTWGYVDFDTSAIPDDATVTSATLRVRVLSKVTSRRFTPANWNVGIQTDQASLGVSLDCTDVGGSWQYQDIKSWATINTYVTYTLGTPTDINLTGRTVFWFYENWSHVGAGQSAVVSIASAGHGTAAYRPLLTVNYTEASTGIPRVIMFGDGF